MTKKGLDGKDACIIEKGQADIPVKYHRLEVFVDAVERHLRKITASVLNELREDYQLVNLYLDEDESPF